MGDDSLAYRACRKERTDNLKPARVIARPLYVKQQFNVGHQQTYIPSGLSPAIDLTGDKRLEGSQNQQLAVAGRSCDFTAALAFGMEAWNFEQGGGAFRIFRAMQMDAAVDLLTELKPQVCVPHPSFPPKAVKGTFKRGREIIGSIRMKELDIYSILWAYMIVILYYIYICWQALIKILNLVVHPRHRTFIGRTCYLPPWRRKGLRVADGVHHLQIRCKYLKVLSI